MAAQSHYPDPQEHGPSEIFVHTQVGPSQPPSEIMNGNMHDHSMTATDTQGGHVSDQTHFPTRLGEPHPHLDIHQQIMAQNAMNLDNHPAHAYIPPGHDGQVPRERRRTKVSRACDACRRKKIRCDAANENGPQSCSSCKRSGHPCQFSRQPLKRGPSKGYIKELADRVKYIERQLPGSMSGFPAMSDRQSPSPFDSDADAAQHQTEESVGRSSLAEAAAQAMVPAWRPSQTDGTTANGETGDAKVETRDHTAVLNEEDRSLIRQLYNSQVVRTLEYLPDDVSEFERQLSQSPLHLQRAFIASCECLLIAFGIISPEPPSNLQQKVLDCLKATESARFDLENASSQSTTLSNQLIYLATLLNMIVEAAQRKASPDAFLSASELIARAFHHMQKRDLDKTSGLAPFGSALVTLSVRLYGALFILDRHNAYTFGLTTILPLDTKDMLTTYAMTMQDEPSRCMQIRLAEIVGMYNSIPEISANFSATGSEIHSNTTALHVAMTSTNLLLKYAVLSLNAIPSSAQSPSAALALAFGELVSANTISTTEDEDLLLKTKALIRCLTHTEVRSNPLNIYYAYAVVASLSDLVERGALKEEAMAAIKSFTRSVEEKAVLPRTPDGMGWDREIILTLRSKSGLLRLADAADAIDVETAVGQPDRKKKRQISFGGELDVSALGQPTNGATSGEERGQGEMLAGLREAGQGHTFVEAE